MTRIFVFSIFLFCITGIRAQTTTISGYITDGSNGEPLLFALVYIPGTGYGITANEYGFYSLQIPHSAFTDDMIVVECKMVGYPVKSFQVPRQAEFKLDIKLKEDAQQLGTVEIVADAGQKARVSNSQMSSFRIPMKDVSRMPSLLGETDIIKIVQLMPGVQKGGEGGTGMYVRGGTSDQNLVLLDEATVYNIGHLFGFFSVFNQDALHDMTMIKGAFPAQYGGRLSSILDIRMKEGNINKFQVTGGIGLLSSRLTIEGPIIKEKASFVVSARRTYVDQVFRAAGQFLPYYFYDLNLKANYVLSDRDRFYFSSYLGDDVLRFDGSDVSDSGDEPFGFGFTLGNLTNTLRWNRIVNEKMFSNLSLIHTKFDYDIRGAVADNNVLIKSDVRDIGVKEDFDYYYKDDHKLSFGGQYTTHIFRPNVVSTSGEISQFLASKKAEPLYSNEFALYGGSEKDYRGGLFKLSTGMRISGSFLSEKIYLGLEPRIALRYMLNEFQSLKFGYSRMKQYMHLVSSSSVSLPTDLWYPVTKNIKPQTSDQFILAWHTYLEKWKINTEVEAYYKWMNNLIEYREGTNLILNNNFEQELIQGKGDSWGLEFLVQRQEGKLNGWIGYTLSWATRDFEELNQGKTYWAKYDRRHNISIVANYVLNRRWDVSAVWVYSSGSRFTPQIGQYFVPNATLTGAEIIPIYTDRNAVSMSPSHRLDINFVLKPRPEKNKKLKGEWHFGAYNVYRSTTPFRIQIVPTENSLGYQYQQIGLFGFIPSIAYNFKF